MVFQNYALYPHMSGLPRTSPTASGSAGRRAPRSTDGCVRRRNCWRSTSCSTASPASSRAASGSGSRWAARWSREPQAFLLDEPLSNLDAKLRTQVRGDLKRLHRELPVTSIYVTHDQVEAMTLGDRLCVMSSGEVQQIGTTDDIYNRPANTFVAAFMGSPPMNLVPGDVRGGRPARRRHAGRRRVPHRTVR